MEIIESRYGIRYEVLGREHLEGAVRVVFNQFYNFEPMMQCLRPSPHRFLTFVRQVAERAANEGLSVAAVDESTRDVAGVFLCDDYAAPFPEDIETASFEPIVGLLGELHDRYAALRPLRPGEAYHQNMAAVWHHYQDRHVGRGLWSTSALLGLLKKGFKRRVGEPTGPVSQQLCLDIGYQRLYEIRYVDFEYDGKKPFAAMDPSAVCWLCDWSRADG